MLKQKFHHYGAAQTGGTIPPEIQVRLKFHQSGPSTLVKLTPTGTGTSVGIVSQPWTVRTGETLFLYVFRL